VGSHSVVQQAVDQAPVSLSFSVPETTAAASGRHVNAIPSGAASVQLTVTGSTSSATASENIDATTCPPVAGAYQCSLSIGAPVGNDTFSALVFSGTNETGTLLASAGATYTVVANEANSITLALQPVASPSPGASPSPSPAASPGTAYSSIGLSVSSSAFIAGVPTTVPVQLTAYANGSPVVGAYAFPITLSDSDLSGATVLQVNGTPSTTVTSSSQNVTIAYSGLAINPFTISASATNSMGSPLPAASPVVVEPYLYDPIVSPVDSSGYVEVPTGATVTVTTTEPGWLGSPYNQSISITQGLGVCNYVNLATPSPGSGTFTLTSTYPGINMNYCGLTIIGGPRTTSLTVEVGVSPSPAPSPSHSPAASPSPAPSP